MGVLSKLKNSLKTLVLAVLKGIGQIMLQENSLTGLLFTIGIFWGSVNMGIAILLATTIGTLTAKLLRFDASETNSGLYGFSAGLVGVAFILFLKAQLIVWLAIGIGSILAAVMQHYSIKRNIPAFTLPFVLVTWLALFIFSYFFPFLMPEAEPAIVNQVPFLAFPIRGYGQVIFQDGIVAGLLFFLGVLVASPTAAIYGLLGGAISGYAAYLIGLPMDSVAFGLFSFNAVLVSIVFAGKKAIDALWASIVVALSLLVSIGVISMGIPQLTFPFVLSALLMTYFKRWKAAQKA